MHYFTNSLSLFFFFFFGIFILRLFVFLSLSTGAEKAGDILLMFFLLRWGLFFVENKKGGNDAFHVLFFSFFSFFGFCSFAREKMSFTIPERTPLRMTCFFSFFLFGLLVSCLFSYQLFCFIKRQWRRFVSLTTNGTQVFF